jgi:hypothetical protein
MVATAATETLHPVAEGEPSRPVTLAELTQPTWSRSWGAANLAAGLGALGALIVIVATGLPQLGFLVWMAGGGMLAVVIYRRRQHLAGMTAGMGARLGALAGMMGFIIFGLLFLVQMLALRGSGQMQAALQQALKTAIERSGDPNAKQMLEQFLTPQGMHTLLAIGISLMLVLFVVVSSLAGMLAATLAGKKEARPL